MSHLHLQVILIHTVGTYTFTGNFVGLQSLLFQSLRASGEQWDLSEYFDMLTNDKMSWCQQWDLNELF
jgi:hypothetical protein